MHPPPLPRYAAHLSAAAALLLASGCGEDARPPTGPEAAQPDPALAVAAPAPGALAFRQVSAGTDHTCGVTTDDRAWCWGANPYGQLGNGTQDRSLRPVAVAGGLRFAEVHAGEDFSCGITTDFRAYCWGRDWEGQLGNGSTFYIKTTPVAVAGGRRFVHVSAGSEYACAVTPGGAAFCWGSNRWGRFGSGTAFAISPLPTRVAGGLTWRRVIAAFSHTCGTTTDDRGYCWGMNTVGQLGSNARISSTAPYATRPAPVQGNLRFIQVFAASGYVNRSGQDQVPDEAYSCGITRNGLVYCWGLATPVPEPGGAQPSLVEGRRFRTVNPASFQACGIDPYDVAFCWSYGTEPPAKVPGGLRWMGLTTSLGSHMCGVTTEHFGYCWGLGNSGQLGTGGTSTSATPLPVAPPEGS